jgi:acetyl-CoA acetyltransferase family protein
VRPAPRPPTARIVVAAGLRTPQGRAGGRLAREDAGSLGAGLARELIARSGIDPAELDEVIAGCAGPPHDQANVARVIALRAGVPIEVPAHTVGRNCASGMEAVTEAATRIEAGRGELFLCLGVEVMSAYPLFYGPQMKSLFERLPRARTLKDRVALLSTFRPSHLKPRVGLIEGLTDPTCGLIMGRTAEVLSREFALSREEADEYAVASHNRAEAARDAGRFDAEIAALLPQGDEQAFEHDEGIRNGQTLAGMAKLEPYFERPDGVVTVGNSCGISDGACALLVTTQERAAALGLRPLARIRSWAWAGLAPARMGLGPVFASDLALRSAGLRLADVGVVELNEAFAVQVLACARAFASERFAREELGQGEALGELDPERTNANGGAIALGHPVGATGARLILTAAHQMRASHSELALATLCIGGGQGGAVVLEQAG